MKSHQTMLFIIIALLIPIPLGAKSPASTFVSRTELEKQGWTWLDNEADEEDETIQVFVQASGPMALSCKKSKTEEYYTSCTLINDEMESDRLTYEATKIMKVMKTGRPISGFRVQAGTFIGYTTEKTLMSMGWAIFRAKDGTLMAFTQQLDQLNDFYPAICSSVHGMPVGRLLARCLSPKGYLLVPDPPKKEEPKKDEKHTTLKCGSANICRY